MFAEKLAGQFKERFLKTLKNALNFRVELKPLFLKSFQGSRTQFQSKILVMLQTDAYVTADLYQFKRPDKPRIVGRYKINMLLLVREYALFVFIWNRQFKLYLRKYSVIQMSLKKHSLYNLNCSYFEYTVSGTNRIDFP